MLGISSEEGDKENRDKEKKKEKPKSEGSSASERTLPQSSDSPNDESSLSDVSEETTGSSPKMQRKKTYTADSVLAQIIGNEAMTRSDVLTILD